MTTITTPVCVDCHAPGSVYYGMGAVRCPQCAESFNESNRRQREAEIKARERPCEECGETIPGDAYGCQECCDHEPDAEEGYHCLNCGKDCSESVTSRAWDRAKDLRKYGH